MHVWFVNEFGFGCLEQSVAVPVCITVNVCTVTGILQQGDMARELSFAIKGTLVVQDNKGTLIELISGMSSAC